MPDPIPINNGTLALTGDKVTVSVKDDHLLVTDGLCQEPRQGRFSRAGSGIKRVAILSQGGYITLAAIRWIGEIGAGLYLIDDNANVLLYSAPSRDYAHLRRSQCTFDALPLATELITAKARGQQENLDALSIRVTLPVIGRPTELDALRVRESITAGAYWAALESTAVNFVKSAKVHIPELWHIIGPRTSTLNLGARRAVTPAQAMLNYAYAILEGETTLLLARQGLDPGIGFMHADNPLRPALAYDVMEPVRPIVDRVVLDILTAEPLRRSDFGQLPTGQVTLNNRIKRMLSEQAGFMRAAVTPYVNRTMEVIAGSAKKPEALSVERFIPFTFDKRCAICGEGITDGLLCAEHLKEARQRHISAVQRISLAQESQVKHSLTQRSIMARRRKWEEEHSVEEQDALTRFYTEQVQSLLVCQSRRKIMDAIGVSVRYAEMLKLGLRVPHPMHVQKLASLCGVECEDIAVRSPALPIG
jgi:CRISPR-associated protein Cas1